MDNKPWDNRPCRICGATANAKTGKPFDSRASMYVHETWHVRKGEGEFIDGELVPIPLNQKKQVVKKHTWNKNLNSVMKTCSSELSSGSIPSSEMQILARSLLLVQIAHALEHLSIDDAMSLVPYLRQIVGKK